MKLSSLLLTAGIASALPAELIARDATDSNPFAGKEYYVNPGYAAKLNQTIQTFLSAGDLLNAARTRTVQGISTFVWVTSVAGLSNIDDAVTQARKVQKKSGKKQLVQLVSTIFLVEIVQLANVFAQKVKAAKDLTFAVILEPDSLGNLVTNLGIGLCSSAAPAYVAGIAYAIAKLQADNVALYIDAAHGGWLGWADNLPLAAAAFAKVLKAAKEINKSSKIRGFATDVSNYNPYIANPRADYTEWNPSYDESHYASSLAPFLRNQSLPDNFIIDQGRSGLQNQRTTWGDWCNIKAGYGILPTSQTNSSFVDAIVWVKPAGESDGACGAQIGGESAPNAGSWWNAYAAQSVVFANPPLVPTY